MPPLFFILTLTKA